MLVSRQPLLFPPGSGYFHSNANYVLLSLIIEQLSNVSYVTFLQRWIFDPLGMGSSGYERDFGRVPGHAKGYGYKTTTTTETIPTDEAAFSDGGLYSTVDDLLRFDQALYGDRLLRQPVRDEMITPWGGPGLNASPALRPASAGTSERTHQVNRSSSMAARSPATTRR